LRYNGRQGTNVASEHLVIAIDGPAGSGKSTVARRLAQRLGLTLLDTGAVYRSLALLACEAGVDWGDGPGLTRVAEGLVIEFRLEGEVNRVQVGCREVTDAIRTPEISRGASAVSAVPEVRQALLGLQRRFAAGHALVAEGRDVGTVVFPEAGVKVFLVASAEIRARRRHAELCAAGHVVELDEVLRSQVERDAADAGRAVAPLRAAPDAITVDTSGLSIDEVLERIVTLVREG
jgi:cytidylate kinase